MLAFLGGEHAAIHVQALIESEDAVALTVLGITEVLDNLVRHAGLEEDETALDLAQLGLANPPDLGPQIATGAGLMRARHYDRRTRALSLADCVAAETARTCGAALASADGPLLETCTTEAIAVIVLPDSNGDMWTG